jgi:hypothetical protein
MTDIIQRFITIDETDKGTICHSIKEGIRRCNAHLQHGAFTLGAYLLEAKRRRLWQWDGTEAKSFHHWCLHEVGYERSQVKNLMGITEKIAPLIANRLATRPDLGEIPPTNLIRLLPYLENKTDEEKYELLDEARNTSSRGLEYNLRNRDGKVAPDECSHEDMQVFLLEQCPTCGGKWKKEFQEFKGEE